MIGVDGRHKGRCGGREACKVGVVVLLVAGTIRPIRITAKAQFPARPINHASGLTEPERRKGKKTKCGG